MVKAVTTSVTVTSVSLWKPARAEPAKARADNNWNCIFVDIVSEGISNFKAEERKKEEREEGERRKREEVIWMVEEMDRGVGND